jgi:hypothetical protein
MLLRGLMSLQGQMLLRGLLLLQGLMLRRGLVLPQARSYVAASCLFKA